MTSRRGTLFSFSGHAGLVITHGSMRATCPEEVASENVLWPKYVIRLPLVSSVIPPHERNLARATIFRAACESPLRRFPACLRRGGGRSGAHPSRRKTKPGSRHSSPATPIG